MQNVGSASTPNNRLLFYNGGEYLTITAGGLVGIGNSNPSSLFTVGANLFTVAASAAIRR
jgi:hypothetical protein